MKPSAMNQKLFTFALSCVFLLHNVAAQYNYPIVNGTSCAMSNVKIDYQVSCSNFSNAGFVNSGTVAANSTVNVSIPSGCVPVKIQVTFANCATSWTCGATGFTPDPSSNMCCLHCDGGAQNEVTVQGFVSTTRADCHP